MESLKNTLNFYELILAPFMVLMLLSNLGLITAETFAIILLLWSLVYHPYISGSRLVALGKIRKQELKYNFIPFWNLKYFDVLFLGKG
ncbi:hypothetical protein [Emticicia sp. TH156]|uniref:hypothetical protein n=1 Tax=Emticicia sp. TH156 TaxID=2067454 RepID=UPI000C7775FA|nr:hypothetical protein [Emticicia sp. TH156]PLK44758.1 hypothetical protein C0V77_09935 [Emticicia sp. TH156]